MDRPIPPAASRTPDVLRDPAADVVAGDPAGALADLTAAPSAEERLGDTRRLATVDPDEHDPWAWAAEQPDPELTDVSHLAVTAVLVTHQAADWLPETLEALEAATVRPTRLLAVDNASTDATRQLLDRARRDGLVDAVIDGSADFGFGDAVAAALEAADQRGQDDRADDRADDREQWLWLLHDDAAPAPDALEQLLVHVAGDPTVDVTGPKLLRPGDPDRPHQISEVGQSVGPTGRRELGLEAGEIDQGQRDQPAVRLALSSCGLLVRRRVWDALGGFDPAVPGLRDGLDLGWRAVLTGHRVVSTPAAEMVHRQVGRAGLRPTGIAGSRPERVDRELGLTLVAAHVRGAAVLPFTLRLVVGSLARALGYLLGKAPGRALDELAALGGFLGHPGRLRRMRRRIAALPVAPDGRSHVRRLRPPWWAGWRLAAETVGSAVANRYLAVAGRVESASLDELTSDDQSTPVEDVRRSPWASPIVITVVLATVGCLVAARDLLGGGSLTGPMLLPARSTLTAAWQAYLDPVPGAPGLATTPWLGLVALGSTVLAGQPEWLVRVLLVGVVPIALVAVYPVVRATITGRRFRLWVALSYALLPPLLGGTNAGRLGLSVIAILLPLLVMAGRSLVLRRPRNPEAWRGGWGAGLVLTALVAVEPVFWPLAAVLAVVAALTVARQPRKIGRLAIAVALPLLVWATWVPTVVRHWGELLLGPDGALAGTARPAPVWQFLIGRTGGPGEPPLWVAGCLFGAVWLVALIGVFRRPRRRAVLAGWLVGVLALGAAVVVSRLTVLAYPLQVDARPPTQSLLLLGFAALVLAGGIGVDGLTRDLGAQSFSLLQPLAVLLTAVVGAVTLLGAGWWVAAGATGPVTRTDSTALPPYVQLAMASPQRVRVLALDLSGPTVRYSVIADDGLRLGDADRGLAFGGSSQAREEVASLAGRLAAGTGDEDIAPQLSDLGIGYVWVTGAGADQRSRIGNTPGLATASGNERGTVWQLAAPTGRLRIVSGEQTTVLPWTSGQRIAPSSLDRVLELGEARDPRWEVTLDGRPLTPVDDAGAESWQQTYRLPSSGGVLDFRLATPAPWWGIGQLAVLLVAAVLAAPGIRRPEVRDPTRVARRIATEGGPR